MSSAHRVNTVHHHHCAWCEVPQPFPDGVVGERVVRSRVENRRAMGFPKPRRNNVWIRYPPKEPRIQAHAIAYTRTAVLVELVDDLNGETAQEIVRSTVDGVGYEIGLITEWFPSLGA